MATIDSEQDQNIPRLTCRECKADICVLRYTYWGVVVKCSECGIRYTIPDEDLVSYS